MKPNSPSTPAKRSLALHARGQRGELWFRLQRLPGGLYVEREEIPRRGIRHLQSLHFRQPGDFERWCGNDPVRFEHPRLHVDLQRDADRLWREPSRFADDG